MLRINFKLIIPAVALLFLLGCSIVQFSFAHLEPVNVSNTSGDSRRVQLIVDGDNVYTVWTDNPELKRDDIFFAKSTDGGKNFDPPINLSKNDGSSAFPRLAVVDSNVYVVWYDYTPGQSDIFFAKSTDGGNNFEVNNISDTPMTSYNPWIGATSNYVYLVFNDGGRSATLELPDGDTRIVDVTTGEEEMILMFSEDHGKNFKFKNLSNTPNKLSWNSRIKVSEPYVYITWNDKMATQSDIFFSKSSDYGRTFDKPVNISNSPFETVDSAIGVYENNVYVVWNDMTEESAGIFFAKSTDNGNTFGLPINLSNGGDMPILNRDGSLAVSGEKIFVVWYDESEKENYIYFTRSTDKGETFSAPINLSPSNDVSKYSQVVADGKNVYVMWNDYSTGNGDIFLRESNDYGATFGGIKNLSNDDEESNIFILGPQIALSQDKVFVVWEKKLQDRSDIFLSSFLQNKMDDSLEVYTLNGMINIEVSFDSAKIEAGQPSEFSFKFSDPQSKKLLDDVNYSIDVLDANENKVLSIENLFAQSGEDTQRITFPQTGPLNLVLSVNGTGEGPIDTKTGGSASIVFTVVPEFPIGVLTVFGAIIGLVIMISFSKNGLFIQKSL